MAVDWRWRDPSHLEAHMKDFFVPVDKLLKDLSPEAEKLRPGDSLIEDACALGKPIWLHSEFPLNYDTGLSGLRRVAPDSSDSFWGYRLKRRIPSHLYVGKKEPTNLACLWGWWEPDCFMIHTLYPGTAAPREIHDPELMPSEISGAIEFWRCNAIVVRKGEYSETPEH